MSQTDIQISNLTLDAGKLCLDFVNTMDCHCSDNPVEYLNEYADLVKWGQQADLIDEVRAGHLIGMAEVQPQEAAHVLTRAVAAREALFRIFTADAVAAEDLALLNEELRRALAQQVIAPTVEDNPTHFGWRWIVPEKALDQLLWPIMRSAADLLTSDELRRVKMCEDERGCGYLFFDTSRNRSRRWCSMESCGNRAKVQRYREREEKK